MNRSQSVSKWLQGFNSCRLQVGGKKSLIPFLDRMPNLQQPKQFSLSELVAGSFCICSGILYIWCALSRQGWLIFQRVIRSGLTVNYHATSRTELLACLPSCPGFVSRYRELQAEGPLPADVSAAFNWGTEDELQGSPKRDRKPLMKEGSVPQLPSLKGSNNESSTDEQEVDSFARQTLYPSRVPWA